MMMCGMTIGDVRRRSVAELLAIRGFGRVALHDVIHEVWMDQAHRPLGGEPERRECATRDFYGIALPVRACNILQKRQIDSRDQLLSMSVVDLYKLKNMGRVTLGRVLRAIYVWRHR